jgi:hypothetical protein
MNKHTPAPWRVTEQPIPHQFYITQDCFNESERQFIGEVGGGTQSFAEIQANAKLIAAAPELLEEMIESVVDLKILSEQLLKESEFNPRFEGMYGIMRNWIERKERLIKKAII